MDAEIEFMWKDDASNTGNCPAQYRVNGIMDGRSGGYIIQGKRVSNTARARLHDLGDDEDAVWVPDNVIDRNRGLA